MGLGDAVSQILAKDVAAPDPVLAKRKTALMKELGSSSRRSSCTEVPSRQSSSA